MFFFIEDLFTIDMTIEPNENGMLILTSDQMLILTSDQIHDMDHGQETKTTNTFGEPCEVK